jgi:hypothetical protein
LQQLFSYTALIIITLITFFSSCIKESNLEIIIDTLKIAKIYQPDGKDGKDAVIQSYSANVNFGNTPHLTVLSWTVSDKYNTVRSLIEFNLTDIPQQTSVKAAFLSFYFTSYQSFTQHSGNNAFTISKVDQKWYENEVTWNNQPSTVFDKTVVFVPKSKTDFQSYTNIDVTGMVQDMIDNPANNHGFMLKLVDELPYRSVVILASSDYEVSSMRPKLVVYY